MKRRISLLVIMIALVDEAKDFSSGDYDRTCAAHHACIGGRRAG